METIDFTEWTTAQLKAGSRLAHKSVHGADLLAELDRREREGVLDDGSEARVEAFYAANRKRRRVRER